MARAETRRECGCGDERSGKHVCVMNARGMGWYAG